MKVNVKFDGRQHEGPFSSWTFDKQTIHLSSGDGLDAQLLQEKDRQLAPYRLFFIALGNDLKNNQYYRISFDIESGPEGYMVITRSIPGQFETREVKQIENEY